MLETKGILITIFRNQTGQVLAVSQLWVFALMMICIKNFPLLSVPALKYAFFANLPAVLIDRFLMGQLLAGWMTPVLIYIQWTLIGWLANVLSAEIETKLLKQPSTSIYLVETKSPRPQPAPRMLS